MAPIITLTPGAVSLADLRAIWNGSGVSLSADGYAAVERAAASVARIVASGETVYGLNTGFGLLAHTRISERAPCRASKEDRAQPCLRARRSA